MKNTLLKNKKGFSFMEMIIIVAMITTMTMTMFTIAYKDRDKKDLETTGREVAASIREAQNYALTGKQGDNSGLPCAFRFVVNGQRYRVQGHYRAIDKVCGSDVAPGEYTNGSTGRTFSDIDLAKKKISIVGHTSKWDKNNPSTSDDSSFVVYQVPFAKYIDAVGASSKGVDIVLTKEGLDKKYHICVHAIGLIEEIGFKDDEMACVF